MKCGAERCCWRDGKWRSYATKRQRRWNAAPEPAVRSRIGVWWEEQARYFWGVVKDVKRTGRDAWEHEIMYDACSGWGVEVRWQDFELWDWIEEGDEEREVDTHREEVEGGGGKRRNVVRSCTRQRRKVDEASDCEAGEDPAVEIVNVEDGEDAASSSAQTSSTGRSAGEQTQLQKQMKEQLAEQAASTRAAELRRRADRATDRAARRSAALALSDALREARSDRKRKRKNAGSDDLTSVGWVGGVGGGETSESRQLNFDGDECAMDADGSGSGVFHLSEHGMSKKRCGVVACGPVDSDERERSRVLRDGQE